MEYTSGFTTDSQSVSPFFFQTHSKIVKSLCES